MNIRLIGLLIIIFNPFIVTLVKAADCKIFVPISVGDIFFPISIWPDGPESTAALTPISNVTPADGSTSASPVTVEGCIGEGYTELLINGQAENFGPDNSFSSEMNLAVGSNTIAFTVKNDDTYTPAGSTFQVDLSSENTSNQVVSSTVGGGYIIFRRENGQNIIVTRYDEEGTELSETTSSTAGLGDAKALTNGGYVISYSDTINNLSVEKVHEYNSSNALVAQHTIQATNHIDKARITALNDGDYAVAYQLRTSTSFPTTHDIRMAVINNGVVTGNIPVDTTFGNQQNPLIATLDTGNFVVVWEDRELNKIAGKVFNDAGSVIDTISQINSTTSSFILGIGGMTENKVFVLYSASGNAYGRFYDFDKNQGPEYQISSGIGSNRHTEIALNSGIGAFYHDTIELDAKFYDADDNLIDEITDFDSSIPSPNGIDGAASKNGKAVLIYNDNSDLYAREYFTPGFHSIEIIKQ